MLEVKVNSEKVCKCRDDDNSVESESVSVRKCAHVEKWGVVGDVRPFGSKLNSSISEILNQKRKYRSVSEKHINIRNMYIKKLFREGCR